VFHSFVTAVAVEAWSKMCRMAVLPDLGHPDADLEQQRALLTGRGVGVLDDRNLTVRAAHEMTGIAAADFSASARPISAASPSTG
jgi:hypothetical protein